LSDKTTLLLKNNFPDTRNPSHLAIFSTVKKKAGGGETAVGTKVPNYFQIFPGTS